MNLGGIFSICLVLFSLGASNRLELSMLGSPQKENAKVFAGPCMCLCEYSVPSVGHPVMSATGAASDFSVCECHRLLLSGPHFVPSSAHNNPGRVAVFYLLLCLHRQHKL